MLLSFYCVRCQSWVRECKKCIQSKRINNTRNTPEAIHKPDWDRGPKHLRQIGMQSEVPPRGQFEDKNTAIHVSSRHAIAHPVSNPTVVNKPQVDRNVIIQHAYLSAITITDKGNDFVSEDVHETAEKVGTDLKSATTKHAQTIGILKRAAATIRIYLILK